MRGAVVQDNDPALSPPVHNHLAVSALTVTVFPYAGEFLCLLFLMTTPTAGRRRRHPAMGRRPPPPHPAMGRPPPPPHPAMGRPPPPPHPACRTPGCACSRCTRIPTTSRARARPR